MAFGSEDDEVEDSSDFVSLECLFDGLEALSVLLACVHGFGRVVMPEYDIGAVGQADPADNSCEVNIAGVGGAQPKLGPPENSVTRAQPQDVELLLAIVNDDFSEDTRCGIGVAYLLFRQLDAR